MDASDPDPGPQEREMNCRPADGSENCGPVIIVFEGREGAPLLRQATDTAQTVVVVVDAILPQRSCQHARAIRRTGAGRGHRRKCKSGDPSPAGG